MNATLECKAIKINKEGKNIVSEVLVYEKPLTIFLNNKKIATLLCSPKNLKELGVGFLRTEELITGLDDIEKIDLNEELGIIEIKTKGKEVAMNNFHSKKIAMEEDIVCYIQDKSKDFLNNINCKKVFSKITLEENKVYDFMEKNLNYSDTFKQTGGVHNIALCDKEKILFAFEDVARHNALDKVIGFSIINNISLKDKILILSGRVSLEMILKAAKLEIPIIISKSAPTTLSVSLAKKLNITLVGFVRGRKMNIYANEHRIL